MNICVCVYISATHRRARHLIQPLTTSVYTDSVGDYIKCLVLCMECLINKFLQVGI